MNAPLIVEDVVEDLQRRYGKPSQVGKSRLLRFGSSLTCSVNFSKVLRGSKFFFGLSQDVVNPRFIYPETTLGDFVLLVCGSTESVLVVPRRVVLEMLSAVPTRRLDVFVDGKAYILQTTGHPKLDVTQFLNAFPTLRSRISDEPSVDEDAPTSDRLHLRIQWALIQLGRAEGCSVWVPSNDRSLSYRGRSFASRTVERLPNFGFEENSRRIVENIDVLWMNRNVITKAFEIEATTVIYSGLLRLNDLVLSQPNNRIELYVAATKTRRERVRAQLLRPSFQSLAPRCEYISFEFIEDQLKRMESFWREDSNARVSGLISGERFEVPAEAAYSRDL